MTMYRKLSFLRNVVLTRADRKSLAPSMSNWLSISAHMRVVEAEHSTDVALIRLQKMLAMELERKAPRLHVIERLHQRVNAHRKLAELSEVRGWLRRYRRK